LPESDKILIARLRSGDEQAFKNLFQQHYLQLVQYGTLKTGDRDVSRELVQEIFLKLWEDREKITIKTSPKAYLFVAMNNKALNWLRHEKVKRAYESERLFELLGDVQHSIDPSPFLQNAISNAINALPEKALQVFTLTQLNGLSNKEASEKLGISVKTVENQITRSRKILQKKLKNFI
jgi:RNA polymerase sigma-70 factor (ECF subfamily)